MTYTDSVPETATNPPPTRRSDYPAELCFEQVPRWIRKRIQRKGLALACFCEILEHVWTDKGHPVSVKALADALGCDRRTVYRLLDLLESTHLSHGKDEDCPNDGTCLQAIVRRKEGFKGRNGWCRFWVNTTGQQADESRPAKPATNATENTANGQGGVTPMSPPPVTPMSPHKEREVSERDSTTAALRAEPSARPPEPAVDLTEVREGEKASKEGVGQQLRAELHHHLQQQARFYGITEKTITTNTGWEIRHWEGWEIAAEDPETIIAVIDHVFTSLTVPNAEGKCHARTIGRTGVRGLRDNWAYVAGRYMRDRGELDDAELARSAGWWAA